MPRPHSPAARARSVSLTIEALEDRTLLDAAGTASPPGSMSDMMNNMNTQMMSNMNAQMIQNAEKALATFQKDADAFQNNPSNVSGLMLVLADYIQVLDDDFPVPGGALSITDVENAQAALMFCFMAFFLDQPGNASHTPTSTQSPTSTPSPTPTPNPTPTPTPTGKVTENIDKAPAKWPSDAKIGPAESVTVTNPTNSPVTVTVSFQGDDGSHTSQSDVCTNNTITVTDGGSVLTPGCTGTFTVSVTGLPDQTTTVTYQ
jgi:hypothetical protein